MYINVYLYTSTCIKINMIIHILGLDNIMITSALKWTLDADL